MTAQDGASAPFNFFDLNDVPPIEFGDEPLPSNVSVPLHYALATIGEAPDPNCRRAAVAALEGACALLAELPQEHAERLIAPLEALRCELRDLDAGGKHGPITAKPAKRGRARLPEATIERRAYVMLAKQWLQIKGAKPRDASTTIALWLGCDFEDVEQFQSDFNKPRATRERQFLQDLRKKLEVLLIERYDDRAMGDVPEDEIKRWLLHYVPTYRGHRDTASFPTERANSQKNRSK
jgi:hypothetical protein